MPPEFALAIAGLFTAATFAVAYLRGRLEHQHRKENQP